MTIEEARSQYLKSLRTSGKSSRAFRVYSLAVASELKTQKNRRIELRSKYNSKRVVVDGIKFDSKAEASRWMDLVLLAKAGVISGLERQVIFDLAPSVYIGGRKKPSLRYFADFVYFDGDGNLVVEDCKGMLTDVYRIKRHLMKAIHGIDILETGRKRI